MIIMLREGKSRNKGPVLKKSNTVTKDCQKIKLGHNNDGNPRVLAHDCSKCKRPGICAEETPITLDDIRRIVDYSDISWEMFFRDKMQPKPTKYRGLGMKRDRHCIFFKEGYFCTIDEVKPMHCKFTPCPIRVQSNEEYASHYLGSGMIEQQFRHHVALAYTKEYVQEQGVVYNQEAVNKYLRKMERFYEDIQEFSTFCERISCYRHKEDREFNVSS